MPVFRIRQHATFEVRDLGFGMLVAVDGFNFVDHVASIAEIVLHLRNR